VGVTKKSKAKLAANDKFVSHFKRIGVLLIASVHYEYSKRHGSIVRPLYHICKGSPWWIPTCRKLLRSWLSIEISSSTVRYQDGSGRVRFKGSPSLKRTPVYNEIWAGKLLAAILQYKAITIKLVQVQVLSWWHFEYMSLNMDVDRCYRLHITKRLFSKAGFPST